MKYSIEGGSLPVAIVQLNPGDVMISEAGARTWARGNVVTETSSEGGLGKSLGRMFAGESLFLSKYTAHGPSEIAFASSFPGRIIAKELGARRKYHLPKEGLHGCHLRSSACDAFSKEGWHSFGRRRRLCYAKSNRARSCVPRN